MVQNENRRRNATIGLLIFAGAGILLLAAALSKARRSPVASTKVADGRIIQIEAVSFGKSSTVGDRSLVLEYFQPWMPQQLVKFFKPRIPRSNIDFDEPVLIVWVTATDPVSRTNVDCQSIRTEFVDEHGDLFGNTGVSWFGFDNYWRVAHSFSVFPRDARTLKLRITSLKHRMLQNGGETNFTSEVEFANPYLTTNAPWTGLPLPQRRVVAGSEIVLKGLSFRTNGGPDNPWETRSVYWDPIWEILSNGKPVSGWSIPEWTATDRLGNHGQQLGTHQPVLRFAMSVYPEATNVQNALLLMQLPAVDFDTVVSNLWWNQTTHFESNFVTALGVLPAGVNVFSDGAYVTNPPPGMSAVNGGAPSGWVGQSARVNPMKVTSWNGHYTPRATIYVHAPSLQSTNRLAVRLRDQQGIYWPAELEPQGGAHGILPFTPRLPANAGIVTPELVVLRPLGAEFTVSTTRP